jgi:hypothetical protein
MRENNKQKWEKGWNLLNSMKAEYLDVFFKDIAKPEFVYIAQVYQIQVVQITKITVYLGNEYIHVNKSITEKNLESLYNLIRNFNNIPKDVMLHYTQVMQQYKASGAYKYKDVCIKNKMSFEKENPELIELQKSMNEKYGKKEGFSPCHYCGKQVPTQELVPYKIIFQGAKQTMLGWVKALVEETNMYCSKGCGIYDQMGHEG